MYSPYYAVHQDAALKAIVEQHHQDIANYIHQPLLGFQKMNGLHEFLVSV